ncbi:MAG: hypothetical protein NC114_10535 [Ruminococcus flavefaciens]|nr:hypothetical protein [Ruminococcus flavefaciens]
MLQKVGKNFEVVLLDNREVLKNHLFLDGIYPNMDVDWASDDAPCVMRLKKPDSVLPVKWFLIRGLLDGRVERVELNPEGEWLHVQELPELNEGEYELEWGFEDALGNRVWRKDSLVVKR